MNELINELKQLLVNIQRGMKQLNLEADRQEVKRLEAIMAQPDFWNNPKEAAQISQEHAARQKRLNEWDSLLMQTQETLELAKLDDHKLHKDLQAQHQTLKEQYEKKEFELKLSEPYDKNNAILHIHAGTGGTDAQDWAQMLERMYLRFAERQGHKTEIITESSGEEAGLKSAIIKISGTYAFGKLRSEHGVHRLVRLSPFNSDNLRQTSFALVEVLPEIPEPQQIEIDPKNLKIDVFRASGKGGQSVNTTDSAVRVTHLPTGIVISIQNERSQLQNRETALGLLRARLAKLAHEQHEEKLEKLKGPNTTEQWGQQIRNYVLHPYTLVKDTRTGFETSDAQAVLDGNIDDFVDAYLLQSALK